MTHAERKAGLEALLLRFQHLWRPQPFRIDTPDWCREHPVLTAELLTLDEATLERLESDNAALIALVARFKPELGALAELIDLPTSHTDGWLGREAEKHLFTDIPGRKQAQIEAYAGHLGEPCAPVLEWCAGKGHLGRLLAHRGGQPVASLEIDAALCDAGTELARRAGLSGCHGFIRADALAPNSAGHIAGRHAVALHACGDLHTRLIADAIEQASPALDIAPCCYYRTERETYRPFNDSELTLSRDDLRLAVTETVTASAKQRQQSRRALAWKLGWVELRKAMTGEQDYRTFPPVPETWLRGTFEAFAQKMCERAALQLRAPVDLAHFKTLGHARAARMLRLQLVRLAFRRPLETWLLMDMAVHLERHGYAVEVRPFCRADLTPRNLLLSARRL